jgi:hypothetical protein
MRGLSLSCLQATVCTAAQRNALSFPELRPWILKCLMEASFSVLSSFLSFLSEAIPFRKQYHLSPCPIFFLSRVYSSIAVQNTPSPDPIFFQISTFIMSHIQEQEWHHSGSSCCSPFGTCMLSWCCPCITYGRTHHRVKNDGNMQGYSCCNLSVSAAHHTLSRCQSWHNTHLLRSHY